MAGWRGDGYFLVFHQPCRGTEGLAVKWQNGEGCLHMFCEVCWGMHLQGCWEMCCEMGKVRCMHRFARRDVGGPEGLGGGRHEGMQESRTIGAEWGCRGLLGGKGAGLRVGGNCTSWLILCPCLCSVSASMATTKAS